MGPGAGLDIQDLSFVQGGNSCAYMLPNIAFVLNPKHLSRGDFSIWQIRIKILQSPASEDLVQVCAMVKVINSI